MMLSFWETQSFLKYDYIIVGSGIVGLSAAASILEKNKKASVLVLERGIFPTGASTKNAGFACFGSLTELLSDLSNTGKDKMLAMVERRWKGIQFLLSRLGEKNTDFRQYGGYELLLSSTKKEVNEKLAIMNEYLMPIFGKAVFSDVSSLISKFGFNERKVKHLVLNGFEGQIDTGKMMKNLLNYVQKKGATILNGCEVEGIEDEKNRVKIYVKNLLSGQSIIFDAAKVAVCTNAFTKKLYPDLEIKPGRGQVLVTKPIKNLKFKGTFHFDEGFYYFRNFGKRVIFGGGRNLDFVGETTAEFAVTQQIIQALENKLDEIILPNQSYEIEQSWAGIMAFSEDRQPILQKHSENVVIGTRLNGMGVAIGSNLGEEIVAMMMQ